MPSELEMIAQEVRLIGDSTGAIRQAILQIKRDAGQHGAVLGNAAGGDRSARRAGMEFRAAADKCESAGINLDSFSRMSDAFAARLAGR